MEKTKKSTKKTANYKKIIIISAISAVALTLVVLLILALTLGWFKSYDNGDAEKEGFSESQTDTVWDASYARLHGRLEKEFSASAEKTLVIEFETVSGEIDLMVYEKDSGNALYIDDMQTYYQCVGNGSYEIPFSEDVVVRLDAREHEGRYSIRVE